MASVVQVYNRPYMKYLFSKFLQGDYDKLKPFLKQGEKLSKDELLKRCTGEIQYELLQQVKELEFDKIGKDEKGELFLI